MKTITEAYVRTEMIVIPRMVLAIEHKQEVCACENCKKSAEGHIKKQSYLRLYLTIVLLRQA